MIVADVQQTIFTTKYLRDICSVMTQENAGLISSAYNKSSIMLARFILLELSELVFNSFSDEVRQSRNKTIIGRGLIVKYKLKVVYELF